MITRRLAAATIARSYRRGNATYQPPDPPRSSPPNRHREFYRTFGRPVAKNFLIALCTYQILYWGWLKLESIETKKKREDEMKRLEAELRMVQREREAEAVSMNMAPNVAEREGNVKATGWLSWLGL